MTVLAKFKKDGKDIVVARSYEMDYRISDLGNYGNDLAIFDKKSRSVQTSWLKAFGIFVAMVTVVLLSVVATIKLPIETSLGIGVSIALFLPLVFIVLKADDLVRNSLWSIIKIPFNFFKILVNKNALYSYTAHNIGGFHYEHSWMLLDMDIISRKYIGHKPETINDIEEYVNSSLNDDEKRKFFLDGIRAGEIDHRIQSLEDALKENYGIEALRTDVKNELAKLYEEKKIYDAKREDHTVRLVNAETNRLLVDELSKNKSTNM